MSLPNILVLAGVLAASVVSGLTYIETTRRGLSLPERLRRVAVLGTAAIGSFLVPYVFANQLEYVYFEVIKSRPVVVSPYEWLVVNLVTGTLVCTIVVVFYIAGSQYTSHRK